MNTNIFAESLIGLTLKEAYAALEDTTYDYRVVIEDGVERPLTDDLDMDRINLEVENGVVINVSFG